VAAWALSLSALDTRLCWAWQVRGYVGNIGGNITHKLPHEAGGALLPTTGASSLLA
jgi:hypothetical protein